MSSSTARPYTHDPYATGSTAAGSSGSTSSSSTTQAAKGEAAGVASQAADSGKHVAGVAKDQAADVVGQAKDQAKDLLGQTRAQLSEQTTAGQARAASGLGSLAAELRDLAEGKGGSGIATDLAHQASERVDAVGSWLRDREPADVLRDVQAFARRRPVAFLAIAAGAGIVAGRLTRGIAATSHDESTPADTHASPRQASTSASGQRDQQWAAPTGTADPVYGATPSYDAAPTYSSDQGWDARR